MKVFSLYFINFWAKINVNQCKNQGYIAKYEYLRKSFSLEALEAAGSGSNLGFNYSPRKTEQGVVDGGCDLKMNCSAGNN
jgi:hypothetical protein